MSDLTEGEWACRGLSTGPVLCRLFSMLPTKHPWEVGGVNPLFSREETGSEKQRDLPKPCRLAGDRYGIQAQASSCHKSVLVHTAVKVRPGTRTRVLRGPGLEVLSGSRGLEVCTEGGAGEAG